MRRSALAIASLGLVLTGCGGDDGDPVADRVGTPAEPPAEASSSDQDPSTGDPGLPVPPDADDLDELMEDFDDLVSGFGSDGGGVVTVAGVRYDMVSDSCISVGSEFFLDGPAQGSDGTVAWIDASRSISTRDDLEEFMDDAMLDMLFGEGDELDEFFIDVRVGATGRFDFDDDQPNWSATSDSGFAFGDGIVEFEFVGNGIRGAGEATDSNGVALDFGQTAPIEFELACD